MTKLGNLNTRCTYIRTFAEFSLVCIVVQVGYEEPWLWLVAAAPNDVRSTLALTSLLVTHVVNSSSNITVTRFTTLRVVTQFVVLVLKT